MFWKAKKTEEQQKQSNYKVRDYDEEQNIFYLELFEENIHALVGELEISEENNEPKLSFTYELLLNEKKLPDADVERLLGETIYDIIIDSANNVDIKNSETK